MNFCSPLILDIFHPTKKYLKWSNGEFTHRTALPYLSFCKFIHQWKHRLKKLPNTPALEFTDMSDGKIYPSRFFIEKRWISFEGSWDGALIFIYSATASPLSIKTAFRSWLTYWAFWFWGTKRSDDYFYAQQRGNTLLLQRICRVSWLWRAIRSDSILYSCTAGDPHFATTQIQDSSTPHFIFLYSSWAL